jgi:hypothetical protein
MQRDWKRLRLRLERRLRVQQQADDQNDQQHDQHPHNSYNYNYNRFSNKTINCRNARTDAITRFKIGRNLRQQQRRVWRARGRRLVRQPGQRRTKRQEQRKQPPTARLVGRRRDRGRRRCDRVGARARHRRVPLPPKAHTCTRTSIGATNTTRRPRLWRRAAPGAVRARARVVQRRARDGGRRRPDAPDAMIVND